MRLVNSKPLSSPASTPKSKKIGPACAGTCLTDGSGMAGAFRSKSKVVESEEVKPGVILDLDENQQVIGVEILSASKRISTDEIKKVLIDVA